MTEGYRILLQRLARPPVNVDLVRQRLTGVIGVNPGDRLCFTLELLHDMVITSRGSNPKWHTIDVVLREVRMMPSGSKILVIDVPVDTGEKGLVKDVIVTRSTIQRPVAKGALGVLNGCVA